MTGFADLVVLDLECADPSVQAEFYRQVLGWDITLSQDDYSKISNGHPASCSPGETVTKDRAGRTRPRPSGITCACGRMMWRQPSVGAWNWGLRSLELQPGAVTRGRLTDPAGHPFCLAQDW